METNNEIKHSPEPVVEQSDKELPFHINDVSSECSTPSPSRNGQEIINTIEEEIGKQLDEKAEKSNLTVTNVKSIIKEVLTNEHMRSLFDKRLSGDATIRSSLNKLKLTRARTKKLLSSTLFSPSTVNVPWVPQPPPSEARVLMGEDLKEDDSGDEYVPGKNESDDERDESSASESDLGSLPPPTPPTPIYLEDLVDQTTYTEDGMFKIPPLKESTEGPAMVALRTRSKISLNSTPLEILEKSFVPPDIPPDVEEEEVGSDVHQLLNSSDVKLDIDGDDEEWIKFLENFTMPLEEISKPTEDEEQDPEYNILADDEINQVDNEDFRMDKGVKITKREVKKLWAELFEYLEDISEYGGPVKCKDKISIELDGCPIDDISQELNDSSRIEVNDETTDIKEEQISCNKKLSNIPPYELEMDSQQICIFTQQFRQHVQMLTQNFILTYQHPEYNHYSNSMHEYLLNLKFLGADKSVSWFKPTNLQPALDLIDDWIELFASNTEAVRETKEHIQNDLTRSMAYKMAKNYDYIVTFPKLILETISKSEVFMYPFLLPKIPFKSEKFFTDRSGFTNKEEGLLVFGIHLFEQFLTEELMGKKVTMKEIVSHVHQYMMPHKNLDSILSYIRRCKQPRCAANPIKQYVQYGKHPPFIHYIHPFDYVVPPCKRMPDELPYQWKQFLYPNHTKMAKPVENDHQLIILNPPSVPVLSPILVAYIPENINPNNQGNILALSSQNSSDTLLNSSFHNSSSISVLNNSAGDGTSVSRLTPINNFVSICCRPIFVQKLIRFLAEQEGNEADCVTSENCPNERVPGLLMNMSTDNADNSITSRDNVRKAPEQQKNKTKKMISVSNSQNNKKEKSSKNLDFSTITSSCFQKDDTSTEVEFCRDSSDMQVCQTSQCVDLDAPSTSGYKSGVKTQGKDNLDDSNALNTASPLMKPEGKSGKKLSGAEKKKNRLRKDFLANLSIATPEDPETEKHKNEMFAVAYYDKLRETLELEDYHSVMQVLNDFTSGDVVDLYNNMQAILHPKYAELAEEFLFFLKEKEAHAVGQLIPWLELQVRIKFLRKLEIYLKDQPAQLKKIYNTLMQLANEKDVTMERVKTNLLPLLRGNAILTDLFLQGFRGERPPASLLEGPYETIVVHKELARPDNEELFENFVVPNSEDKYGGPSCICHCHRIEDNEYKSRYKHCNSCGLKFANGKLYLSTGRMFQPATVTFKTSPNVNHNIRLSGKSVTSHHKKKRSDNSPNKSSVSNTKDNVEEDTEDDEISKRKKSVTQKTPRKRRRIERTKGQDSAKPASPRKSPARNITDLVDVDRPKISPKKRTYFGKKSKKEGLKKTEEINTEHQIMTKLNPEQEAEMSLGPSHHTETEFIKVESGCVLENDDDQQENVPHEDFEFIKVEDGCELGSDDDQQEKDFEFIKMKRGCELENDNDQQEEIPYRDFEIVKVEGSCEWGNDDEQREKLTDDCMDSSGESVEKPLTPGQQTAESGSEIYLEESSQDNYESYDSISSIDSPSESSINSYFNDEPPWKREEDTIILEILQKEDDKEYALQIIAEKLPNRTVSQIRDRLLRLMDLLSVTLKNT